jgi:pSer/pThr/pTyr-binding forkhead associated (FHA) protein
MSESALGSASARLVWHKADGTAVEFPVTADKTSIGRDPEAGIFIDEPLVSRVHAEIVREGSAFVLRDLGSRNLTRVNDCTITRCALHDGDELRFARARCVFACTPASGAASTTPL